MRERRVTGDMVYRRHIKPVLDRVLAGLALLVLSPMLLCIALVIRADSPGRAVFCQNRAGMRKKNLRMYKFRTMYTGAPDNVASSELIDPDKYITRIGHFLRRSSLDELPQLFNILKGEMSFVGPRPLVWSESDVIGERERLGVYEVKPGLTGWAQVNGRDEIDGKQKCALDAEYVKNMSFSFDLKCIWKTFLSYVPGVRQK